MNWTGKKVLVTGAGGFIGSHLAEELTRRGASTRAMVRYVANGGRGHLDESLLAGDIEIYAGDVTDQSSITKAMEGIDIVFHLAALIDVPYSYEAPESYIRTNVLGTLKVLQAARAIGVQRLVQTSTSEVYGSALYVPMDENHPLRAQSPYAASKIGADKLAEAFHASFQLPVTIVRPFNTYGPRQSIRAVIPAIIMQCLTRDEVHIGATSPTRDFTYVGDTVAGFIAAAESDRVIGETLNLGTGIEVSIGDLARRIGCLSGRDVTIVTDHEMLRPSKSEVTRLCSNNRRACELIGWHPVVEFDQGLADTIAWARDNSK